MNTLQQLCIICPLVFFAGFVDSIAGGGGIISLPAYYVAGIPPRMALGTNKFASTFGTFISAMRFIKNKKADAFTAMISTVFALIGSYIGAKLTNFISDQYLRYILLVALPILAVFIITNKNLGKEKERVNFSKIKTILLCMSTGFFVGGYDGFFGPGTGTFLIIIFHSIIGFDLLTASGNAKIVNLASNVAALAAFLHSGHVFFLIGVPAAICSIAGNYLGSHLALKNGAKIIRPAFVLVLILLLCKIAFDLLK